MDLIRLTYTSVAVDGFQAEDLRDIVAKSQRNNRLDDVTGFMMYAAPNFTQCLEGERPVVKALLKRIAADPQHTDIRLLASCRLDTRQFADWSMQLLHLDEDALKLVAPLCEQYRLDLANRLQPADEDRLMGLAEELARLFGRRREAGSRTAPGYG